MRVRDSSSSRLVAMVAVAGEMSGIEAGSRAGTSSRLELIVVQRLPRTPRRESTGGEPPGAGAELAGTPRMEVNTPRRTGLGAPPRRTAPCRGRRVFASAVAAERKPQHQLRRRVVHARLAVWCTHVLEPDLHSSRGHTQLDGELLSLLCRGEARLRARYRSA